MQAKSLVGTIIADKYQLISIAGSGGMGTVYKARHLELDRLVAVKILDPQAVACQALKRFEREARAISSLSNEHIASFYAYSFLENQVPYIVMEWLDGISLSALIASKKGLDGDRAVAIALEITDGLAAAHRAGIIHRDLKPANVLLLALPEPDFVKIVDFGLAAVETGSERLTRPGFLPGTPSYLSPEQCRGERADARSDIYALGCILYEMICGEPPFAGDDPAAIIQRQLNEAVLPPSRKSNRQLAGGLETVTLRCLSKSAADRYQTVEELRDDLSRVQEKRELTPPVRHLSPELAALRRKVIVARIVAVSVLAAGLLIWAVTQWSASENGTVAGVEFALKNNHSRASVLACLDVCERLLRQGRRAVALKIEQAVDRACKIDTMQEKQAARAYLELGADLLKRGDNETAFDYGFAALKSLHGPLKQASYTSPDRLPLLASAQDAAEVMNRARRTLSRGELSLAMALTLDNIALIAAHNRSALLDLCLEAVSRQAIPPSDDVLKLLFARDLILASSAAPAELEKSLSKSADLAAKYEGKTAVRPLNNPTWIIHLLLISECLQERDRAAGLKYVGEADSLLQKVDRAKLMETDPESLAGYLEMTARIYTSYGELEKAVDCARQSVACRALQDLSSARCLNTLCWALVKSGALSEAEPLAMNAYEFYKAQEEPLPEMLKLRSECALQLFHILAGLNQQQAAGKLINAEIKEQQKHLPDNALSMAELYGNLLAYYGDHSQSRAAAECARQIMSLRKYVTGNRLRMKIDSQLVECAVQLHDARLMKEPLAELMAFAAKLKDFEMRPEMLDSFRVSLALLKKTGESGLYSKVLELVVQGFAGQLNSGNADQALLARVVNDLGASGEEKIADSLRSSAVEKLAADRASVFLSRSMDFVVGEGKEGASYADPQHAIKVYLDLAHNMQSKGDGESAGKYAFEALKIVHVLAGRKADLRAGLLTPADDAAGVILFSRVKLTDEQDKIIRETAVFELAAVKKAGKDKILELAIRQAGETPNSELISCAFARDEMLAKAAQTAALEAQVGKTVRAAAKLSGMTLPVADHLSDLADLLYERRELPASRHYLSLAGRTLEEMPKEQSGSNVALLAQRWNRLGNSYARLSDRQSALDCARRAVMLRPVADAGSGEAQLVLCDRLCEAGNLAEAESLALAVSKFASAHAQSADLVRLRLDAGRRLFALRKDMRRDAEAVAAAREALASCRKPTAAQALQMVRINRDLALYYLSHDNLKAAGECLAQVRQLKVAVPVAQKSERGRSELEAELLCLAVKAGDSRLASQSALDLLSDKDMEKADSIRLPGRWWSVALTNFKKTGETHSYTDVLSFVQDGFRQQLARSAPDAALLAEVVCQLADLGEDKLSVQLRDEAARKLAGRDDFLSRCKNKAGALETATPAETVPNNAAGGENTPDTGTQTGEPEEPAENQSGR
jgi:hypothetical protein